MKLKVLASADVSFAGVVIAFASSVCGCSSCGRRRSEVALKRLFYAYIAFGILVALSFFVIRLMFGSEETEYIFTEVGGRLTLIERRYIYV